MDFIELYVSQEILAAMEVAQAEANAAHDLAVYNDDWIET